MDDEDKLHDAMNLIQVILLDVESIRDGDVSNKQAIDKTLDTVSERLVKCSNLIREARAARY